jgi:hypothetical protein
MNICKCDEQSNTLGDERIIDEIYDIEYIF